MKVSIKIDRNVTLNHCNLAFEIKENVSIHVSHMFFIFVFIEIDISISSPCVIPSPCVCCSLLKYSFPLLIFCYPFHMSFFLYFASISAENTRESVVFSLRIQRAHLFGFFRSFLPLHNFFVVFLRQSSWERLFFCWLSLSFTARSREICVLPLFWIENDCNVRSLLLAAHFYAVFFCTLFANTKLKRKTDISLFAQQRLSLRFYLLFSHMRKQSERFLEINAKNKHNFYESSVARYSWANGVWLCQANDFVCRVYPKRYVPKNKFMTFFLLLLLFVIEILPISMRLLTTNPHIVPLN